MSSLDVIGACPLDCPDTCSWVATVDDGEAIWPFDMGGGAMYHDNGVEVEPA